jgi:A118 family predicted phage portal protein
MAQERTMMNISEIFGRIKQMLLADRRITGAAPEITPRLMQDANDSMQLFCGKAPWLADGGVQTLNLPSAIAGEVARLVTVELSGEISGGARAQYLNIQLQNAFKTMRAQCEYAAAGGGIAMKPYVENGAIRVDFIQAQSFVPLAWAANGEVTAAAMIERAPAKQGFYTRIEKHALKNDGYYIENTAYYSASEGTLGMPLPLSSVPQWAQLEPQAVIRLADGTAPKAPLFVYFKMPFANNRDTSSPLGVSVYSRAEGLLEQADRQYTRILWEYEGSELAIDASVGALQTENGDFRLPRAKQRLFRELGIDKGDGGDLYSVFSPAIRDASLFNGLNNILRRIEFACYLSYGTLSDPTNVDKTAEEIKMSKQRSYSAVCDIQKALAAAISQLVYAMDILCSVYALAPQGEYSLNVNFGDAIAVDTETQRAAMRADCEAGAAAWWEYRVRFYGEDEVTARQRAVEASGI